MTQTPQTEAENTPKLHIFGNHFRYWREKRGYSLKEAAGNTMSVASLSRFETDKQSITIEKLAELLMNIGVDIADFMTTYGGQRIQKYTGLTLANQMDDTPTYYQAYPEWLNLIDYVNQSEKYHQVLNQELPKPLSADKIEQILLRDPLNLLELEAILRHVSSGQFPVNLIPQLVLFLKEFLIDCTSTENGVSVTDLYNFFPTAIKILQFLSRQGYHQEVFSLVNATLKQINQMPVDFPQLFLINLLQLQMFEVYSLIRSGEKTKAFKRRQEITQSLDALIGASLKPEKIKNYLITIRTNFDTSCTQLLSGSLK